jgi:hypothetical protein
LKRFEPEINEDCARRGFIGGLIDQREIAHARQPPSAQRSPGPKTQSAVTVMTGQGG